MTITETQPTLEERFAAIYREHDALYRNTVRKILYNPEDAEEVLQEGYIKIWRGLPDARHDKNLGSWGYSIMHNVAVDRWRSIHGAVAQRDHVYARAHNPRPTFIPLDLQSHDMASPNDVDPLDVVLAAEQLAWLDEQIARLPFVYRVTLELAKHDLPYQRISHKTGKSRPCKTEKYRAIRMIRENIAREKEESV